MKEPQVVHRIRMSQRDAHYGGDLVSGARLLELMGDAATEICIRNDGDEGLLAGYANVEFVAPVFAGDFLEIRAELVRVGRTSREIALEVLRYARPSRDESDSAADLEEPPVVVARATSTGVVKAERQRRGGS